jgi:hypothetical protein
MSWTAERLEQIPEVCRDFMLVLKPVLDSRAPDVVLHADRQRRRVDPGAGRKARRDSTLTQDAGEFAAMARTALAAPPPASHQRGFSRPLQLA